MVTDVVVVAAGKGSRFGTETPKQFLELSGKPILAHVLQLFDQHPRVRTIVVVGAESWLFYISDDIVDKYHIQKVNKVVQGGPERPAEHQAGPERPAVG